MPVAPLVPFRVFVPNTAAKHVFHALEVPGPVKVSGKAQALLLVVSVAVGLHRDGPGGVAGGVVSGPSTAVGEGDGRFAALSSGEAIARAIDEVDQAERAAPFNLRARAQFRFRTALIVPNVDQIGGHPIAPALVLVEVDAGADVQALGHFPFGLQVTKGVGAQRRPALAVNLIDVGDAGPLSGQPVPAIVFDEFVRAEEALIVVFVGVVVGEVAG